jgi:hypothetical protein
MDAKNEKELDTIQKILEERMLGMYFNDLKSVGVDCLRRFYKMDMTTINDLNEEIKKQGRKIPTLHMADFIELFETNKIRREIFVVPGVQLNSNSFSTSTNEEIQSEESSDSSLSESEDDINININDVIEIEDLTNVSSNNDNNTEVIAHQNYIINKAKIWKHGKTILSSDGTKLHPKCSVVKRGGKYYFVCGKCAPSVSCYLISRSDRKKKKRNGERAQKFKYKSVPDHLLKCHSSKAVQVDLKSLFQRGK